MDPSTKVFLTLGAVLLAGLLAEQGSRRTKVPSVTLLLILGLVFGPELLDVLPSTDGWFPIVSTLALTMVGFLLGGEFSADRIHEEGRPIAYLAVVQGVVTGALVSGGLLLAGIDVTVALTLGGIAVATAPAATLAVVQERHAEGPFTRTLLGLVALDDVIALTSFGLLASVAAFISADGGWTLLAESVWEVAGALGLGLLLGLPGAALTGRIEAGKPTQEEAYGLVLLCAGFAQLLDVSFLLAAVALGATIANRASHHEMPFREIERIEWPALVVFFVLAGASLEVATVKEVGWLGAGYVVLRTAGKLLGGALGASVAGLPPGHRRWLGAAMLPQAGVAIGLSLLAAERFPDDADQLLAVVISATVVFEFVGPLLASVALERVGESRPTGSS